MPLRQRFWRLFLRVAERLYGSPPGVEWGAGQNVCIYWPEGRSHPDLAITFMWNGWRWSEFGRPRNISPTGAYWHWPLGLGCIDWWGQRLSIRALRRRTHDRIDRFDVPRGVQE